METVLNETNWSTATVSRFSKDMRNHEGFETKIVSIIWKNSEKTKCVRWKHKPIVTPKDLDEKVLEISWLIIEGPAISKQGNVAVKVNF